MQSLCKFGDWNLGLLKAKKCLTVWHFRFPQVVKNHSAYSFNVENEVKCFDIELLSKHIYVILYKCYLVCSRMLKLFLRSPETIFYKGTGVSSPIALFILNLYTKWDEPVTSQTLHFTKRTPDTHWTEAAWASEPVSTIWIEVSFLCLPPTTLQLHL